MSDNKNNAAPDNPAVKPEPTQTSAGSGDLSTVTQSLINPDDLHDLISGSPSHEGGSDEEDPLAQLRKDPNYAALIAELEYIAAQARLLFEPAEETPSDELWNKIQSKLPTKPEE